MWEAGAAKRFDESSSAMRFYSVWDSQATTRRPCTQRSQRTTRVKCVASHVRRSLAEACFLLGPLLSPGHRTHQQHGSFRPCGYFNYIF